MSKIPPTFTPAREIRRGDMLVGKPSFLVRNILREGDEVVVLGGPGVVRRFDLNDEVHVRRKVAAAPGTKTLYHVTFLNRLSDIAEEGLVPGSRRSIGGPALNGHAQGKLFLTTADGVSFWLNRADMFAYNDSDNPVREGYIPIVLRVRVPSKFLSPDDVGTGDAGADAFYTSQPIEPSRIEYWGGRNWSGVQGLIINDDEYADIYKRYGGGDDEGDLKPESPLNHPKLATVDAAAPKLSGKFGPVYRRASSPKSISRPPYTYFTSRPEAAEGDGELYQVTLALGNPLDLSNWSTSRAKFESLLPTMPEEARAKIEDFWKRGLVFPVEWAGVFHRQEWIEPIRRAGYDGLIFPELRGHSFNQTIYVSFNPSQIKRVRPVREPAAESMSVAASSTPLAASKRADGPAQDQSWMGQPGDITETPAFKAWFAGSQVVDDHGRPLRVYHGTTHAFEAFAKKYLSRSNAGGLGFFFSVSPDTAARYSTREGGNLRPAFLRIRNPFVMTSWEFEGLLHEPTRSIRKQLQSEGFDGILLRADQQLHSKRPSEHFDSDTWIAFEPQQVRSAFDSAKVALNVAGLKQITREQAIKLLSDANANGKNKGSDSLDDFKYLKPGAYVLTDMPLTDLDYISQDTDRQEFYAAVPGKFPPVYAVFGPRSLKNHLEDGDPLKANVGNGNHRCVAAELRGDKTIPTIMNREQYEFFQKAKRDHGQSKMASAPPAALYHGTTLDNAELIRTEGLRPGGDDTVHLSEHLRIAQDFAKTQVRSEKGRYLEPDDQYAVVVVDSGKCPELFENYGSHNWMTDYRVGIPAAAIIRIDIYDAETDRPIDKLAARESKGFKDWARDVKMTPASNSSDLTPSAWVGAENVPAEPFLGKYTLRRINEKTGRGYYAVYDGDKVIASMTEGSLVVDPKYRKQGIATELAKLYMQEFPDYRPSSMNTKSRRVFERAHDAISKNATPENPILVVVHPGSACGSADFNLGKYDGQAARDGLIIEFNNWQGGVIILSGELDDELPSYPRLNQALQGVLARAKAAGKVALRVKAYDPAQITVIKRLLKKPENRGTEYVVTGAWLYDGDEGCAGSVYQAIKSLGFKVTYGEMVLTDMAGEDDDDEEYEETDKQAAVKLSYVQHMPGHKNSKGEAAPWVVKSHEDGHVISSHKTEGEAREHLRQMEMHKHMKSAAIETAEKNKTETVDLRMLPGRSRLLEPRDRASESVA